MNGQPLNLNAIEASLSTKRLGKSPGWSNELWQSTDSTNARALQLAKEGAPEGVVVLARQQTAGRGRLGRTWMSPPDSGLYISIVLRPQAQQAAMRLLSFAAGVAAAQAVECVCGYKPGLKWVNDIVTSGQDSGKKLGGILCEMISTPGSANASVVVGIGINVFAPPQIPQEISSVAAWIDQLIGMPPDINLLTAALLAALETQYDIIQSGQSAETLAAWRKSTVTLGQRIKASNGQLTQEGLAADIAEDGALLLQLDSGEIVHLHSGDVSIRRSDGTYS